MTHEDLARVARERCPTVYDDVRPDLLADLDAEILQRAQSSGLRSAPSLNACADGTTLLSRACSPPCERSPAPSISKPGPW